MNVQTVLIAVTDMERSKAFYKDVLDMDIEGDFGANVLLKGGVSLQTIESWPAFIGKNQSDIRLKGYSGEIYFETDDFDGFVEKLSGIQGIRYACPPQEHPWGQRA